MAIFSVRVPVLTSSQFCFFFGNPNRSNTAFSTFIIRVRVKVRIRVRIRIRIREQLCVQHLDNRIWGGLVPFHLSDISLVEGIEGLDCRVHRW